MKKRILLFTAVAGMSMLVLTSGQSGAGFESGYNSTGSETGLGNINGCKASGCHGTTATTGITVSIELDSAGIPRHYYTPGITYTVKITGTNTTAATNLAHFGFQISCIKGSTAVTTPVNAGTFPATGSLPTGIRHTAPGANFVCDLIEHSTPLAATSGTGGSGTTYVASFNWTAPAAGTGSVSFWGALNAVNFDHAVTGDFWNTTKLVVTEGIASVLSVAGTNDVIELTAFPNPTTTILNLQLNNAQPGTYTVQAFNMNGSTFVNQAIEVTGATQIASINTANWAPGVYNVTVSKDGSRKSVMVVKQ